MWSSFVFDWISILFASRMRFYYNKKRNSLQNISLRDFVRLWSHENTLGVTNSVGVIVEYSAPTTPRKHSLSDDFDYSELLECICILYMKCSYNSCELDAYPENSNRFDETISLWRLQDSAADISLFNGSWENLKIGLYTVTMSPDDTFGTRPINSCNISSLENSIQTMYILYPSKLSDVIWISGALFTTLHWLWHTFVMRHTAYKANNCITLIAETINGL